ncbi:MAG: HlyD family secretion protein [Epsilonproteobacteria bacterium]|nr:HlyD family secretion protein [Campylobacterota bacterium]
MRHLLILLFALTFSHAKIYYAKVEPYDILPISSNVTGLVLQADESKLGKTLSSAAYIVIDSELDKKELGSVERKLTILKDMIATNEQILKNLESSLEKKRENYKRVEALKIKSTIEKDREFYDLIASENSYLATQKEIENLHVQLSDLSLRQAQLQRTLKDKELVNEGYVLYELYVKPGQVVTMSAPLAKVADVSKAKLTLFLDEADAMEASKKVIYIDGKKSAYRLTRVVTIADSKNISKYMAQIIIDAPKLFSKLVQIELKDE